MGAHGKHRCSAYGCINDGKGNPIYKNTLRGVHRCCFYCEKKDTCPEPCMNSPTGEGNPNSKAPCGRYFQTGVGEKK